MTDHVVSVGANYITLFTTNNMVTELVHIVAELIVAVGPLK